MTSESDRTRCETSDNVCRCLQCDAIGLSINIINMFDVTLTDNIQYQSQLVNTDNTITIK